MAANGCLPGGRGADWHDCGVSVGGTALHARSAHIQGSLGQGSLGRCRCCRRLLVGEYRKPQMDDGCDDGADDRGQTI